MDTSGSTRAVIKTVRSAPARGLRANDQAPCCGLCASGGQVQRLIRLMLEASTLSIDTRPRLNSLVHI